MSAKWKKIIWGVCMINLLLFHIALLNHWSYELNSLSYRVSVRLSLPQWFYDKGTLAVLLCFLAVSGIFLLYQYLQYHYFRKQCMRQLYLIEEDSMKASFQKACEETGLVSMAKDTLFGCDLISTPFVLGVSRPVILIPGFFKNEDEIKFMLLHECYHVKQRDGLYKIVMLVMNCLLWFQPFAYIIRHISFMDIEIACDEAVVKGKNEIERSSYGEFLIQSLKLARNEKYLYSTFFYGSQSIMKARIRAVMEQKRKWDYAAKVAVVLLLIETCIAGTNMIKTAIHNYKESNKPDNIYEGYELPQADQGSAPVKESIFYAMAALAPAEEDTQYEQWLQTDDSSVESFEQLPYEALGPWQVRLKNKNRYSESLAPLWERYLSYFGNQEWGTERNYEDGSGTTLETVYERLLAGDMQESVFAVVLKKYVTQEEIEQLPEKIKDFTLVTDEKGNIYAYFQVAMHIKMAQDYVFELIDVQSMDETVSYLKQAHPDNNYSDIPVLNLKYDIADKQSEYLISTQDNQVKMQLPDSQQWESVPVSLEELCQRGDTMDGVLTSLQEGSYQCDGKKQIFSYGGSFDYDKQISIPVSVVYFDENAGAWRSSEVTDAYQSVRKLLISFPENEQVGYLVLTTERVMWQEGTVLFQTKDAGKTWEEIGPAGPDIMAGEGHSLTTDMSFVSNNIGFLTIRDSEEPDIWMTRDGGGSWEKVKLENVPEYYCMAYAPEQDRDRLVLYIGMEEYSKYAGKKAYYISTDNGVSWEFGGYALRK